MGERSKKKELQAKANMALGKRQEIDMFHSLESSLKEMRELQKINTKNKETPFLGSGEEEEIENEKFLHVKKQRQSNKRK